MSVDTEFKTLKDIPAEEYLSAGSPLCAGCGGLLTVRLFHKVLGPNVAWTNAAGCMTMLFGYPFAPIKSNWLYSVFSSAPGSAQGIGDALDVLQAKGKIPASERMKVVVVTGDGAAYDIGLQSTSGAIQRNLDFYYLCYDNESYGNTGFQMSSSTPYGSATRTSEPTVTQPEGYQGRKKNLFEIWRAHSPPYVGTISSSHAVDLMRKVERASKLEGSRLFIALAGCPTGWGFDPQDTIRVERLAVETGMWPLKEAIDGVVKHTVIPRSLKPVEEYLRVQQRYAHLFSPTPNLQAVDRIQQSVNAYWKRVSETEGVDIRYVE